MNKDLEVLEPEIDIQHAIEELVNPTKALILYNDDYNTFPHVIECLVKYCDHSMEQAEQCALLVHHTGRCDVKHGSYDKLKPVCEALLEQGLTAKIE
jgi:ATP-dependent Clp protease adaptor protein ClpS